MTYTITVTAGPYTWTCTEGETPTGLPVLLDALTLDWSMPDGTWPQQPEPVRCNFGVFVAGHAEIADLTLGSEVAVTLDLVEDATGGSRIEYYGRVTALTAAPRTITLKGQAEPTRGMTYLIQCADHLADLADLTIGSQPWPQEGIESRFTRIADEAGLNLAGYQPDYSGGAPWVSNAVAALDVDARPVLDLLNQHVAQWTVDGYFSSGFPWGFWDTRPILQPGDPADPTSYVLDWLIASVELPAIGSPGLVAGRLTVAFDHDDPAAIAAGAVSACRVEGAATWTRTKFDAVNRVVLSNQEHLGRAVVVTVGPPPYVTKRMDVDLVHRDEAYLLGETILDTTEESGQNWQAEAFTWRLDRHPVALANLPALFPVPTPPDPVPAPPEVPLNGGRDPATVVRSACFFRPLILHDIPPTQSPNNPDGLHIGRLTAAALTIEAGNITADLSIGKGPANTRAGADAITWADVATLAPTLDWTEVDGTWTAYRLARHPA